MRRHLLLIALSTAVVWTATPTAEAQRSRRSTRGTRAVAQRSNRARPRARRKPEDPAAAQRKRERTIAKKYLKERTASRRGAARFFEKITVQRNYTGEYVLSRNTRVTAFLDLSDPKHPKFDPKRKSPDEEHMAAIPPQKRVHVLVVPNAPREHIGQTLGGSIGRGDLETTLKVVKEAEKLAVKLKIKNPKVFLNAESRIGVGYLHVHITGERTASTRYPKPLVR